MWRGPPRLRRAVTPIAANPAPFLVLGLGVLSVSSAAILVRFASEAPPLVIGAYRLAVASLAVVPAALLGRRTGPAARSGPGGGRRAALTTAASGLLLAVHLGAWIASLSYTSVASSTVLVTTTPVMLALLPARWRGDPLTWAAAGGVLVACLGAAVIAFGDAGIDPGLVTGDALALLGAAAMAGHRIAGRGLLRNALVRPLPYLAVVYPIAGVFLAGAALALGQPLSGFRSGTLFALLLLGLVPQLIGHSALNWALTRVSAVAVSTAVTGEPLAATVLALVLLNERPTRSHLLGGILVLGGTYAVLQQEGKAHHA